jgi:hypothetical protein
MNKIKISIVFVSIFLLVNYKYFYEKIFYNSPNIVTKNINSYNGKITFTYPFCNDLYGFSYLEDDGMLLLAGRWLDDGKTYSCFKKIGKGQGRVDSIKIFPIQLSLDPKNAAAYPDGMTWGDIVVKKNDLRLISSENGVNTYRRAITGVKDDEEVIIFIADDGQLVVVEFLLVDPTRKTISRRFDKGHEVWFAFDREVKDVGFYKKFDKNAMYYLKSIMKEVCDGCKSN